jgi:hypothetical protein
MYDYLHWEISTKILRTISKKDESLGTEFQVIFFFLNLFSNFIKTKNSIFAGCGSSCWERRIRSLSHPGLHREILSHKKRKKVFFSPNQRTATANYNSQQTFFFLNSSYIDRFPIDLVAFFFQLNTIIPGQWLQFHVPYSSFQEQTVLW